MEGPKQKTSEEIVEIEKSRTISDAELLRDGAEYVINEGGGKHLRITDEQFEKLCAKDIVSKGQEPHWDKEANGWKFYEDGISVITSGEFIHERIWNRAIAIAKELHLESICIKVGWGSEDDFLHLYNHTLADSYIGKIEYPSE